MTTYIYDMAATWTDSGTAYDGIKMNVTDTASAATSLLLNLKVGGVGKFTIGKDGGLRTGNADSFIGYTYVSSSPQTASQGVAGFIPAGGGIVFAGNAGAFAFSADSVYGGSLDARFTRIAAGVVGVRGASGTDGGALNLLEQTAPSAPAADQVVLYAEDNGSGKTRLMAKFATGSAVQVAIQP